MCCTRVLHACVARVCCTRVLRVCVARECCTRVPKKRVRATLLTVEKGVV
jgi:hypothetical protein